MRVAYLLTWTGDRRTGVFKKVIDQVSSWRHEGVEGAIFVATSPASAPDWQAVPDVRVVETYDSAINSFAVQRSLVKTLSKWKPDVTYVRTSARHAAARDLLSALQHVIEIQTNDLAESRKRSSAHHLLTRATRRGCLQGARGLVFVSRELSNLPSYSSFTQKRTVIANGIDLGRITPLTAPNNHQPRLVFIGSPSNPWHGVDDILRLANLRPDWSFDLIGEESRELHVPPNVEVHGQLSDNLYQPILAKADVAISTLAWYRNDMNEASPLKSREYFALGLPVIGSYEDTDVSSNSEFYLRLPNKPKAIVDAIHDVERFIRRWQGRRVERDQIQFLDSNAKERQRLAFLQSLS